MRGTEGCVQRHKGGLRTAYSVAAALLLRRGVVLGEVGGRGGGRGDSE